jgi:sugar O-acyltransferase (sialic acid O-acetyltransferase NeuD family)
MPRPVVILGGAGSGVIVAETIKAAAAAGADIETLGFLNDTIPAGTTLADRPVIGPFAHWIDCPPDAVFISAIPKPKESRTRHTRILSLGIPRGRWTTIVHPKAQVAADTIIGPGSFVGAFAIVEPGTVAGAHTSLRGGCYLSHDVRLGDYVFVGPNASVLGRSKLGDGAHVGANAVCREEISIGRYAVIGLGAVVVEEVPEFAVVAGSPARVIGHVHTRPKE